MAQKLTSTMYLYDIIIHHLLEIILQIKVLIHNCLTYRGTANSYKRSSVDGSRLERDVRAGIFIPLSTLAALHTARCNEYSNHWETNIRGYMNTYTSIYPDAYLNTQINTYIKTHIFPIYRHWVVWNPIFSSKYFLIYISSQQIKHILPDLFNFTTKKHICKCREWLNRLQDLNAALLSISAYIASLYRTGRLIWAYNAEFIITGELFEISWLEFSTNFHR